MPDMDSVGKIEGEARMYRDVDLSDRIARLDDITSGKALLVDRPLLKSVPIPHAHAVRLSSAVIFYLWETICAADPSFPGAPSEDFFDRHIDRILALPNVTPNGVILPKKENLHSYNVVQKVLAEIFGSLEIDHQVEQIQVPVNIRVVSGSSGVERDRRPRATTKAHSDVWAADPAHGIIVFVGLFGDLARSGIEFYEPASFPAELIRPLANYDEGAELMKSARQYPEGLGAGQIMFCDPLLLHRTMNRGGGARLSIEFRFLAKNVVASDLYRDVLRTGNYIDLTQWREIGKTIMLVPRQGLREFRGGLELDYEWHPI